MCSDGACVPAGLTSDGEACVLSAECAGEAQCAGGACVPAGDGAVGETCADDADCADGLRCALGGFWLHCVPEGDTDVEGACTGPADCFAGLSCVARECQPAAPGVPVFGLPTFDRVECADPVGVGETVRALFEVPGAAGAEASDFFSLPFPNDIRLVDGHPSLEGFPSPGADLFGFDPVHRYVDAIAETATGWGANPAVIFRFSGQIDVESLTGDPSPIYFVDVTAGTPEYGDSAGFVMQYSPARTNALCADWLSVTRPLGAPLLPQHTYAVWINDDVRALDGSAIERSSGFEAMLAAAPPTDVSLAAAWERFQPLRDFADSPPGWWETALPEPLSPPDADHVLTATVITVEDVIDPMRALAAAVEAAPAPTATGWTRCDGVATSPCPQADGDRSGGEPRPDFVEYHALASLPRFQQGTPPYRERGGSIADEPVATDQVCLALTVPTGTMPDAGWPLVVFAHGAGGSFRSHASDAVAGALSAVGTTEGTVSFAVLGVDQVGYGSRRAESDDRPEALFFNLLNPDAARGNVLQAAADQLALIRLARVLESAANVTGGAPLRFDSERMVLFGHSQGATAVSLALPFSSWIRAGVLSGNGASTQETLLTKRRPLDVASVLPYALGDPQLAGSEVRLAAGAAHPALTLIGQWLDPADPLHFARLATREPPVGQSPKHVFQTYGLGDTYSPPSTLAAYALAGDLGEATPDVSVVTPDVLRLTRLAVPASGNVFVGSDGFSALLRQYQPPDGSDGHFVVFDLPSATADIARFLALAALGTTPVVGE